MLPRVFEISWSEIFHQSHKYLGLSWVLPVSISLKSFSHEQLTCLHILGACPHHRMHKVETVVTVKFENREVVRIKKC
jgi:hypothetical protein